jgi:ADP-heptose:LPS heptosyltransferase
MNPDVLRFVDKWIGSTACRCLGFFSRGGVCSEEPLAPPRGILIIKLTEMGSSVLALPALRELRATWPDAEWYVVVFRNSRAILDLLEVTARERILEIDDRSVPGLISSAWRVLRCLRRVRPEVSFDFDFFSRLTAVFAFLACRGARVGYQPFHAAGAERGKLLTHRVIYSPLRHTSEAFLALIRSATRNSAGEPFFRGSLADADLSLPRYKVPENIRASSRQLLADAGVPAAAKLVLMNTNASELLPLRRWPRDRFVELIQRLLAEDTQLHIILVGGKEDVAESNMVADAIRDARLTDLCGRTSLAGFLALCEAASVIVCNDGGPAHFAGLVDCPSVVMFGPESPDLYRPLASTTRILYHPLPCSPCVHAFNAKKSACRRAVCLEEISVEEALKATEEMLALNRP